MLLKFILVFLTLVSVAALPVLFLIKAVLQLQYQNLKTRKPLGAITDFFVFDYKNAAARSARIDAFLLFPIFFPIDLEEGTDAEKRIKRQIRRVHLLFYVLMIVLLLLASYLSKAYPNGFFS
jgi:hypothetical protein